MAFTPHTDEERRSMLDAVGVSRIEELFDDVPQAHRFPQLTLPPALSEMELAAELKHLARRNVALDEVPSFAGAGSYRHFIPATVDYVLQRGEFYTSYTPYQPELSQGMLQAMFEYQTMICRLTGMEVSNASHYDGATSLAEAVLLALDETSTDRNRVLVSSGVHPHYRTVVETYLRGSDANFLVPNDLNIDIAKLVDLIDETTAALVIQSPDFLGRLQDLKGIAERVHQAGALLIVVADPIALGLFEAPGTLGSDVVVCDGQPLGIAPNFGGPSLGIFATRRRYIRRLAGRLVGQTIDSDGRRGYVLTLATREQHIRRAKATSNICTNSALGALAAATYLSTLGKRGLRRVAELCYHKSNYAAAALGQIPSLKVHPDGEKLQFFKEFVIECPLPAAELNQVLWHDYGIVGGCELGRFYPERDNQLLLAVTEMNTRPEIDRLVVALREIVTR